MKTKTEKNGYKVVENSRGRITNKVPLFCPNESCKRITSSLDDSYMLAYGICSECYIMLVEGRQEPLIDVAAHQRRLKERGY
jgi:hypothetical protein